MKYKPEYATNIIVGVKYGIFNWYVTDQDFWILDAEKRREEYIRNGYGSLVREDYFSFRFNIPIINDSTVGVFLSNIADCKVKTQELKELVLNRKYENTVLALAPSLFVDFDKKILYSNYPELLPFERYVPDGWKGEHDNFLELIPHDERYWMDGYENMLIKIYTEENKMYNKY